MKESPRRSSSASIAGAADNGILTDRVLYFCKYLLFPARFAAVDIKTPPDIVSTQFCGENTVFCVG